MNTRTKDQENTEAYLRRVSKMENISIEEYEEQEAIRKDSPEHKAKVQANLNHYLDQVAQREEKLKKKKSVNSSTVKFTRNGVTGTKDVGESNA